MRSTDITDPSEVAEFINQAPTERDAVSRICEMAYGWNPYLR